MFTRMKDISVAVAELAESTDSNFNVLCWLVDYYAKDKGMGYEKAFNKVRWTLDADERSE